jgi:energy-coupling factor transporter transmembrane protein EcfT
MGVFMLHLSVHPATRLAGWVLLVVVVQSLEGLSLVVCFLLLPLFGLNVLRRGWRLICRAKWLLISLFVIFSWGVPGNSLWIGPLAPTLEGVSIALIHLGRLILVLMVVAAFLQTMSLPDLLVATHTWLKPLRRMGFDSDRGVVRLMLVLRYVESLPRPRDWRSLLDAPVPGVCELVEVDCRQLRPSDYVATVIFVVATILLCFR